MFLQAHLLVQDLSIIYYFELHFCQSIGLKFAMLELKMTLIKIMRKFEVQKCDNTVKELDFAEGVIGIFTHPVVVAFKRRIHQ